MQASLRKYYECFSIKTFYLTVIHPNTIIWVLVAARHFCKNFISAFICIFSGNCWIPNRCSSCCSSLQGRSRSTNSAWHRNCCYWKVNDESTISLMICVHVHLFYLIHSRKLGWCRKLDLTIIYPTLIYIFSSQTSLLIER